ncbi:toll/interleukin-1 receptor domain-containing protein [Actinophytocola glycyrrhizae]|uniref:Toll/interleukin-1 receptor domain-containing protein n=1 Tax=Actinophytocola glycyrrhizae TaxID=2044873 RepID=A0ABV9S138_9PSEU
MHDALEETLETYDVCLSFADEQRSYVEEVATLLTSAGLRVFYDSFETADLWGRDLYEHLDEIYSRRSRFCVLFISADYSRKVWTNHERAAAQERALNSRSVYVLPVRFDETRIPGIRSSIGYLDAKQTSPAELVTRVLAKLGHENHVTGVAACVLAVAAKSPSIDCEARLHAAIEAHDSDVVADLRRYPDGTAVAVIPVAAISLFDVFASVVPALEKAIALPGARARIVLHRAEIAHGQGLNSVDVTATVSAAGALARSRPVARQATGCVLAISHRAHAELVRSAAVTASDFRKADTTANATPWDIYIRTGSEADVDEEPRDPIARVSNTVQNLTAENVVFGVQVTKR